MLRSGAAGPTSPRSRSTGRGLPSTDFGALRGIGLTPRQCEVLGWVAQGKRDADIATILGISPKTVGKHLEHLLAKLDAENRTAAVSIALERLPRLGETRAR
jgi:DNA-binding CsgD family transcriptional regulator